MSIKYDSYLNVSAHIKSLTDNEAYPSTDFTADEIALINEQFASADAQGSLSASECTHDLKRALIAHVEAVRVYAFHVGILSEGQQFTYALFREAIDAYWNDYDNQEIIDNCPLDGQIAEFIDDDNVYIHLGD